MRCIKIYVLGIMPFLLCQCGHFLAVHTNPSGATISTSWGNGQAKSPARFTVPDKQAPVTLTAVWPSGAKATKTIKPIYKNNGYAEYECKVWLPRPSNAPGAALDYSVGLEIDRQNLQRQLAIQQEIIASRAIQSAEEIALKERQSHEFQQEKARLDASNERARVENERNAQRYQQLIRDSIPKTYIIRPDPFELPGSSGRTYRIREE